MKLVQFDFACDDPFGQEMAESKDGLVPAIENLNAKLFDVYCPQSEITKGPM